MSRVFAAGGTGGGDDGETTVDKIEKFAGQHSFLSNFSDHPVTIDGETYPTSEHAFQALKTDDPAERAIVRAKDTPGKAKRAGKKVTLRPDWERARLGVMERVVRAKFEQHPEIAQKLQDTGETELIEGNSWNDTFWGVCRGKGKNKLGLLLMLIRSEL